LPQTARTKQVIAYSIEEARKLNHNYVGTEHVLLGLLREEEGVAARVLMNLGLDREAVRTKILDLLGNNLFAGLDHSAIGWMPYPVGRPLFPAARRVTRLERLARKAGRAVRAVLAGRPKPTTGPAASTPDADRVA